MQSDPMVTPSFTMQPLPNKLGVNIDYAYDVNEKEASDLLYEPNKESVIKTLIPSRTQSPFFKLTPIT